MTPARDELLSDLRATRSQILAEQSELDAALNDVGEQIARLEGEPLLAEFCRLAAESCRARTPEARQAAHRALIEYLADGHLRRGQSPTGDYADEVEARMEELIREREASQHQGAVA